MPARYRRRGDTPQQSNRNRRRPFLARILTLGNRDVAQVWNHLYSSSFQQREIIGSSHSRLSHEVSRQRSPERRELPCCDSLLKGHLFAPMHYPAGVDLQLHWTARTNVTRNAIARVMTSTLFKGPTLTDSLDYRLRLHGHRIGAR